VPVVSERKATAARRAGTSPRALPAAPARIARGAVVQPGGEAPSAAEVQAAAEGVVLDDQVEFKGESFRLAEEVPALTQLKFAHAAARGIDSSDPEGMSAMYMFIRACIYRGSGGPKPGEDGHDPAAWQPGDFQRFEDHADATCAGPDELLDFVAACMEKINARPTRPRSGSPRSGSRMSPRSRAGSSSRRVPEGAEDLVSVDELVAAREARRR